MSEEKKLTDEEIVNAYKYCVLEDGNCDDCPYKYCGCGISGYDILYLTYRLQAENERLKENLANEKKWGKIQTKQAEKDTARKIFGELDLFFKGTTFRQGYEFKKIDQKLKEMAKNHDVGVEYEN